MLRRNRRRERKRSAQAISSKRQGALYAVWGSMAIAIVALVCRAGGAGMGFCLAIFAISVITGAASLVYAHFMWKREHEVLCHGLPLGVTSTAQVVKSRHHRVEDSHRRAVPARGATRIHGD